MKLNLLWTMLFLMMTGIVSNGQSIIGLSGGYNYAFYFDKSASPHYAGSYHSHPTYSVTAYLKGREKPHHHIGFETSYISRVLDLHASYGGLGSNTTRDVKYNLQYLYFSIYPEWAFGKKITLNISIGPSLGFLLNSSKTGYSSRWSMSGPGDSWIDSGSATSDFVNGDFRVFARFGLELPLQKNFKLSIESNFSRGIVNIGNGGLGSYAEFINSRDISLNLGLIYKLNGLSFSKLLAKIPNTQKLDRDRERAINSKKD